MGTEVSDIHVSPSIPVVSQRVFLLLQITAIFHIEMETFQTCLTYLVHLACLGVCCLDVPHQHPTTHK